MIIFKAAIYKGKTLQQLIESISIDDAERLMTESTAAGLRVFVAAFLQDGRHLEGVYQEMGPTIYGQPFATRANAGMDAEDISECIETLRSIAPQYEANLAYIAAQ